MPIGKAIIVGIFALLFLLALPFIILAWVIGILIEAIEVIFS